MKAWYLLYCKAREELRAQQNLQLQHIESYLPMISERKKMRSGQYQQVMTPLFPSYLFIYFDPLTTPVSRIHSTRGCSRLINCQEKMLPLDPELITRIKIRLSTIGDQKAVDTSDLNKGDKVKFTEGPFAELEGVFEEKSGEKRSFVLLSIMGQMKKVQVPTKVIEAVF
ncbi:MAG: transcription/translation regulatory transformer protein RfaH [Parashewanella sp.]